MKKWIIDNWCMFSAFWILGLIGTAVITCLSLDKGVKPTSTQSLILSICLGCMGLSILLCLCSRWLPKWYACDAMGWHMRPQNIVNNGHAGFVHNNGTCPKCGKEVMQDSQGNWF
jgi:predicted RNA-binding Zn-ribbon protein involved in translation (DUF1610 family)